MGKSTDCETPHHACTTLNMPLKSRSEKPGFTPINSKCQRHQKKPAGFNGSLPHSRTHLAAAQTPLSSAATIFLMGNKLLWGFTSDPQLPPAHTGLDFPKTSRPSRYLRKESTVRPEGNMSPQLSLIHHEEQNLCSLSLARLCATTMRESQQGAGTLQKLRVSTRARELLCATPPWAWTHPTGSLSASSTGKCFRLLGIRQSLPLWTKPLLRQEGWKPK